MENNYSKLPVPSDSIEMLGCCPLYGRPEWQHPIIDDDQGITGILQAYDFLVPKGTDVYSLEGGIVTGVKVDSDVEADVDLVDILYARNLTNLKKYADGHSDLIEAIAEESEAVKDANNLSELSIALTDYYFGKMNYLVIEHEDGSFSQYVHLDKDGSCVKEGDRIEKGQLLGYSGNSGYSRFPHLHVDRFKPKDGVDYKGERFIQAHEENSLPITFSPEVLEILKQMVEETEKRMGWK